jgi:hypothetical protein
MADAAYGSLPFAEQNAFFRRKLNLATNGWTDVYTAEHDWAFVVAGANRDDLVADFRTAVEKAIVDGTTLEDFRRDFDRIVAKHGWSYNGGRGWRSKVIYETNLRSSYQAGRYAQLMAGDWPYWEYVHSDAVVTPRPQHLAWDGMVLRRDDPWWQAHFPPNGWGCQCTVRPRSEGDLKRLGKSVSEAPEVNLVQHVIGQNSPQGPRTVTVPEGIDPGFEYTPGRARLESAIPPERGNVPGSAGGPGLPNRGPLEALPTPRQFDADRLLPTGLSEEDYVGRYLAEFGATLDAPAIFTDVTGERLVIGKDLFTTVKGDLKVTKRGREQYLPMLADALKAPDEIWVRLEWMHGEQRAVVRRRYVAQYQIEGQDVPALAVFETGPDGWSAITTFQGTTQSADDWRIGVRLYRRQ